MRARLLIAAGVLGALALLATTEPAMAGRYEEPVYTVEAQEDGFEIRSYEGWIEARVTLPGDLSTAVGRGFNVLAGYIFGANQARTSIDMTTPVTAEATAQRIDMTAPVAATVGSEGWTVSFMMPSRWTLETLPVPDDARIDLVEVSVARLAVRTFSGRAGSRAEAELAALRRAVDGAGWRVVGPPTVAQFDPPWILGPWRRNEVRLPVEPSVGGEATPD